MKRKLACFGLCFALAEMFAATMPPLVLVPAAALLVFLLFLGFHSIYRPMLLGALSGALCFFLFALLAVRPVESRAGQTAWCTVTVETDAEPSYQEGSLRGTLHVTQCGGETADFRMICDSFPGASPGERFTARFQIEELENSIYLMTYKSRGVYLQAEYLGGYTSETPSHALRFSLLALRRELAGALRYWMPDEEGELEAAVLLGHKNALRDSVQDTFRTAGISHLLAVSGLHVTLLCGIFSFGYRRRFFRPFILLRAVLVLFYMFLTGLPVSVLRAGIVFLLSLAGDFFLQPSDPLTSTGVAALLIGLQNAYAPCDVGFQLSFCAVLGVQLAGTAVQWEQNAAAEKLSRFPEPLTEAFWRLAENLQVAVLAGLTTLPVLVAQGMTASGVSVLSNLLVVWMLQFALQLGMLILAFSVVPFLVPLAHMASLVLSLWLHWMIALAEWCAGLPLAQVDLPRRYTLLVLAVLALLAVLFWKRKRLLLYLPAAALCAILAVALGVRAQQDVVRILMVGASNNPSAVCIQNGRALVLFRGGQSNLRAVTTCLAEHGAPELTMLIDLRQAPSDLDFGTSQIVCVEELSEFSTLPVLDGLTLDLYHKGSGNLAVLGAGDRHVAVMAGNIRLVQPVSVDVLCAAGALSESVRADTIVYCSASPSWLEKATDETLLYSFSDPVITIRPGHSMIFEEVEHVALQ